MWQVCKVLPWHRLKVDGKLCFSCSECMEIVFRLLVLDVSQLSINTSDFFLMHSSVSAAYQKTISVSQHNTSTLLWVQWKQQAIHKIKAELLISHTHTHTHRGKSFFHLYFYHNVHVFKTWNEQHYPTLTCGLAIFTQNMCWVTYIMSLCKNEDIRIQMKVALWSLQESCEVSPKIQWYTMSTLKNKFRF